MSADELISRSGASSPDEPARSEDGVDLTLIRWMLSLTPAQRLEVLQSHQAALDSLRKSGSGWTTELS